MRVVIILGHPDTGSFNHAIADAVTDTLRKNNHRCILHDLYREKFPPILPAREILKGSRLSSVVDKYCTELQSVDGIVVVHPNWWGQPPAIVKGWIDRVMRPGIAYEFTEGDSGEGIPIGLLKAKAALVFTTSNTPSEREQAVFGDPLDMLWKNCIFGLCGIKDVYRKNFGVIVTSTLKQRQKWLMEVQDITGEYFPF